MRRCRGEKVGREELNWNRMKSWVAPLLFAGILRGQPPHGRKLDSDLRIALVRHPDFAKKVRSIVVEFASTAEQSTLDRYIRGENVPRAQLEQVWKNTTQAANAVWDSPIYAEFFAAVRDVNSKLHAESRIRLLAADS